MYLDGRWYRARPRRRVEQRCDADAALDVSRLQDRVLAPVLGIQDVRTDKRIDFVGGIRGTDELARLVDAGDAAVAFSLYPVTVGDLMHDCRCRRHHAAEVDLVRAEAAGRPAVASHLGR